MNNIKRFEVGKTYTTTSMCDSDCVLEIKILRRTAQTVTAEIVRGVINGERFKTLKIDQKFAEMFGHEAVKPWGSYSMAPIVRAA